MWVGGWVGGIQVTPSLYLAVTQPARNYTKPSKTLQTDRSQDYTATTTDRRDQSSVQKRPDHSLVRLHSGTQNSVRKHTRPL